VSLPRRPNRSPLPAHPDGGAEPHALALHKGVLAAPDRFAGYARLASQFRVLNQADAADRALRRARAIAPDEPRLLVNAATLWLTTGIAGDPERALRRALCLEPALDAAADRLLLTRKAAGALEGAARVARWAVCRRLGERTAPLLELAVLRHETGNTPDACRTLDLAFRETVPLSADPGPIIGAAGRIGGDAGKLRVLRQLLCHEPNSPVPARELASLPEDGGPVTAIRRILTRLRLAQPFDAVVQNGAGVALERQDRTGEAMRCYIRAALLEPGLPIALFNVGTRSRYAGDFRKAERLFERALAASPGDPIFRYNLGHVLLATGRSRRGLSLYEERWRSGQSMSHRRGGRDADFRQPRWHGADGTAQEGPILIWGEQGLGDEIWFAGYVPGLFADKQAVLECDPRLTRLFSRSGLAETVVARTDPPHSLATGARWQIAAGSLPLLDDTGSVGPVRPAPRGYLKVDPTLAARLRARLAAHGGGPTIGISWRSRKRDPAQTFEAPLAFWGPVLNIPNATLVCLQYDATTDEIDAVNRKFGVTLARFEDIDPFWDIDGLATLISVLDHVVSIANVNVALCHGVGRTCHVALRHYQEDWRFQRDRSHSAWLPGCRLYWPGEPERPAEGGEIEWRSVFSRIGRALTEPVGTAEIRPESGMEPPL
jgi:Flp pilus assembly protein TadD